MEQKNIQSMISFLLTIVFLSACAAPAQPSPTATQIIPTQVPPATSTEVATEAPATEAPATAAPTTAASAASAVSPAAGLCLNPYYPVHEGSTWMYKSTGSPAGEYKFTDTITAIRPDGFTLTSQFEKLTRTQEWSCKPEGLVALQLGGAALNSQNVKMDVQTQNVSGLSYPKDIQSGQEWDYGLDFSGKLDLAGTSAEAKGNDKNHFKALGTESVTVPAGTFDALKVQIDTDLGINASVSGLTVPVTFSASYTYWFVKEVGWVKATGTGSLEGKSFGETIELQAYNIP